jgi:hypothetical protein
MVAMGMGDDHGLDPRRADRRPERREMRGVLRAGIHHDEWTGAEEIGVRAPMGHRRGVRGEDSPQPRLEFLRRPVVRPLHPLFLPHPLPTRF